MTASTLLLGPSPTPTPTPPAGTRLPGPSQWLVDTVTAVLHNYGCQVRLVLHPVMGVERGPDGRIEAVTPARGAPRRESVMHFEVDRRLDPESLESVRSALAGMKLRMRGWTRVS